MIPAQAEAQETAARGGPPRRSITRRLVALGLGLLLSLVLFEVALRVAGYDPLFERTGGRALYIRPSAVPGLDYEPTPGARAWADGIEIVINSHGFRDREYTVEKPTSVRRVVVLGDSIPFGVGIAAEDTYPEKLEQLYTATDQPVEILNLAVGGYDTVDAVTFFEAVGARFDPDVVVLGYCLNDLGVNSLNSLLIALLNEHGPWFHRFRTLQFLALEVERRGLAFPSEDELDAAKEARLLREGAIDDVSGDTELARILSDLRTSLSAWERPPREPFLRWHASSARVGKLRHALERLAVQAESDGFEVVVVLVPFLTHRGHPETFALAFDVVEHEARRLGFDVVDATAPFRRHGLAKLRMEHAPGEARDPLHPNAIGHGIVAEELYRRLDLAGGGNTE